MNCCLPFLLKMSELHIFKLALIAWRLFGCIFLITSCAFASNVDEANMRKLEDLFESEVNPTINAVLKHHTLKTSLNDHRIRCPQLWKKRQTICSMNSTPVRNVFPDTRKIERGLRKLANMSKKRKDRLRGKLLVLMWKDLKRVVSYVLNLTTAEKHYYGHLLRNNDLEMELHNLSQHFKNIRHVIAEVIPDNNSPRKDIVVKDLPNMGSKSDLRNCQVEMVTTVKCMIPMYACLLHTEGDGCDGYTTNKKKGNQKRKNRGKKQKGSRKRKTNRDRKKNKRLEKSVGDN